MIKVTHKGNFSKTERFFNRVLKREYLNVLEKYGEMGVAALRSATPVDSGATADAWSFEIGRGKNATTIGFTNSNVNDGVNIAIILRYGHGTGTGGFVQGRDYISPAIQPVFDKIADELWKEVTAS